jgi:hypothetical protein
MKAVILQPMYLPWMGYFDLIDKSDVFVFFDDVQFVGRSWQQRNKIKTPQGWTWLTVPISRALGSRIGINEVRIDAGSDWKESHLKSIRYHYGKAPFFQEYIHSLDEVYGQHWDYLADLNIALIKRITALSGLEGKFVRSSELGCEGVKTEHLINISKAVGADEYISGPAAKDYMEVDKFRSAGIKLYWHEFHHPSYPQIHGEFVPYMSIIDLLFNTGRDAVNHIRDGGKEALILDEATE